MAKKPSFKFNAVALLQQLTSLVHQDSWLASRITAEQLTKLIQYLELLAKWNQAINLSAIKDPEQMVIKHLLDSLVVAPYFTDYTNILDVGTGAGLPGIPLAILFASLQPEKHFYLLDALGKRIQFLRQVVRELQLPNVTIIHSRVEDYHERQFDAITSRAFTSLDNMTLVCEHLLAPAGKYMLLKGKLVPQELASLPSQFTLASNNKVIVPGLDDNDRFVTIIQHQS